MAIRKENDSAYQKVGNASTWERYISLAYHAYDHCFQFKTQWEKMKANEKDAVTFISNLYSYHLNRAFGNAEETQDLGNQHCTPIHFEKPPIGSHTRYH
jgi:hypothetical protein